MKPYIDPKATVEITEIMRNRYETVLFGMWIEKINTKQHLDKRLLVMTESIAALYWVKHFPKSLQMKRNFKWFEITKIEVPDQITMKFHFTRGEISFKLEDKSYTFKLLDIVIQHLREILSEDEFPSLEIPAGYNHPIISSRLRGVKRLRAKIFGSMENPNIEVINKYKNAIFGQPKKLYLKELDLPDGYLEHVLDSLVVEPTIETVVFPRNTTAKWPEIGKFFSMPTYVKNVKIYEKIDPRFDSFPQYFQDIKNTVLQSITFSCPKYRETNIAAISEIYSSTPIQSLQIVECSSSIVKKITEFSCKWKGLKELGFHGVANLDLKFIVTKLHQLTKIILVNCNIDVGILLYGLSSMSNCRVKSIDLTSNRSQKVAEKRFNIPPSLEEIILDKVDYRSRTFIDIFKKLITNTTPLKLSFKDTFLENDQWQQFYQSSIFKFDDGVDCVYTPKSINWDGNVVQPQFFELLDCCINLQTLSLSECFKTSADIISLLSFIPRNQVITSLIIKGTKKQRDVENVQYIQSSVRTFLNPTCCAQILEAVAKNRTLEFLDLSYNEFGVNVLDELANTLYSNQILSAVRFKLCKIPTPGVFTKFIDNCVKTRGKPLSFRLPYEDILKWQSERQIDDNILSDYISKCNQLKNGNRQIEVPQAAITKLPPPPKKQAQPAISQTPGAQQAEQQPQADEWFVDIPEIPPIDEEELLSLYSNAFSIQNMIQRLRQPPKRE